LREAVGGTGAFTPPGLRGGAQARLAPTGAAPVPDLEFYAATRVMTAFRAELAATADASTLSARLMSGAFNAASSSIATFFEIALPDVHKLPSAIVATVRSMVAQLLAEFARLELARFFGSILGFLGLGPAGSLVGSFVSSAPPLAFAGPVGGAAVNFSA